MTPFRSWPTKLSTTIGLATLTISNSRKKTLLSYSSRSVCKTPTFSVRRRIIRTNRWRRHGLPSRASTCKHFYVFTRRTGVSNGLIQFKSARKIWPLLELLAQNYTGARLLVLAKFLQLLACLNSR